MTGALIRRLDASDIGFASVHPGSVDTEFYRASRLLQVVRFMGKAIGRF